MNMTDTNYLGKFDLAVPCGGLKTQLAKLLMSVDRIGWQNGATSGRFDVRRASRMIAGSERVFKMRWEQEAKTSAVTIVIDLSSSMSGLRARAAAQTAHALAESIERANCEVRVVGFQDQSMNIEKTAYMRSHSGEHGTDAGIEKGFNTGRMVMLKDFAHKLSSRRKLFEYMHHLVLGCTPDYHVVRTAVEMMSIHKAERKLVIVVTDGMGDVSEMRKLTDNAQKLYGVTVMGIGIQVSKWEMSQAYKFSAVIEKVSDLATVAMKSLIDQISGKQKKEVLQ